MWDFIMKNLGISKKAKRARTRSATAAATAVKAAVLTGTTETKAERGMAYLAPKKTSLADVWPELEIGLKKLFCLSEEGMSYNDHMVLYNHVVNHCSNKSISLVMSSSILRTNESSRSKNIPGCQQGANFVGAEMYDKLVHCLTSYLDELYEEAKSLMGSDLLKFFQENWGRFGLTSRQLNSIFSYLNRFWVKRESENTSSARPVYDIRTLAYVCWRKHLFNKLRQPVMSAVMDMVCRERNGEVIDGLFIKSVVDCTVCLSGVYITADDPSTELSVYREYFEDLFIKETEHFYIAERENFLEAQNSVADFLRKVEERLQEEEKRVQMYLDHSSKPVLLKTLVDVLIKSKVDVLNAEFDIMLREDRGADLERAYRLLGRIADGHVPLQEMLESHITHQGQSAIEQCSDKAINDAAMYIEILLSTHTKYLELVQTAFSSDKAFIAALDKACRVFVNNNAVTDAAKSTSKSPELLAKFCDSLLKQSAKNPEESELEELLSKLMTVFHYLEDKDVFQKFYSRHLSRRLVLGASASDDAEENMIGKLKQACGYEYTNKLQRMFSDVRVSADLNKEFQASSGLKLNFDFNMQVLSAGAWPLQAPKVPFKIPPELEKASSKFISFYTNKHSGRRLAWLYSHSRGEIKTGYLKSVYTLQASTHQMGVLLLFNTQSELTLDGIVTALGLEMDLVCGIINILLKARFINSSNGESVFTTNGASNDVKFTLNLEYKSKRLKVNINVPIKAEQKKESEEVHKNVDEDRKLVMQASLVRIMKMRKSLSHQLLINECVSQVSTRFKPSIAMIKKCIDILIEKDYLRRAEDERGVYEYIA